MGLLIVLEGDHQAEGPSVDLSKSRHVEMLHLATAVPAGFPLVRRMKEFYRDADFDADEVPGLQRELEVLSQNSTRFQDLIDLVGLALEQKRGLEGIAD